MFIAQVGADIYFLGLPIMGEIEKFDMVVSQQILL